MHVEGQRPLGQLGIGSLMKTLVPLLMIILENKTAAPLQTGPLGELVSLEVLFLLMMLATMLMQALLAT